MRQITLLLNVTFCRKSFVLLFTLALLFVGKKIYSQEIIASQYFSEEYAPVAKSLDTIPVISKFVGATSTNDDWPYLGLVWEAELSTSNEKTSTDPFSLKLHNFLSLELIADNEEGLLVYFSEVDISQYDQMSFSIAYASDGDQKQHDDLVLNYEYKLDDVWVKVDSVLLVDGANNTPIDFGQTIPNITQPNNPYVTPPGAIPNNATSFKAFIKSRNYQGSDNENAYYIDDVVLSGITAEVLVSGNDTPIYNGQTGTSPINNTDFENVVINEAIKIFEYTIDNTGSQELNLTGDPLISLSGDTDDFLVSVAPITPILPDEASFFTIVFQPKSLGSKSITVSIANDDLDQNPYTFKVDGTGVDDDHMYCDPTEPPIPTENTSYFISNISVGTIDNTSTYVDPDRYSYFSEFTTNLNRGDSYFTRILNETLENSDSGIGIWIDYNDDGDFEDTDEEVYTNLYSSGLGETNVERTFSLLIPDLANPGVTRMRIAVQEGEIPTPCGPFNQTGEVEDYDVTIVDLTSQVPEVLILGNGIPIENGNNTPDPINNTDFGLIEILSSPKSNSFTIANIGGLDLTLEDPSPYIIISGDTADFILTEIPTSPITPLDTSTFEITFNPQSVGIKSAVISIANNDSTNNPYTFSIQGEGFIPVPEIDILGNGILITNGDTTPRDSDGTDYGNIEEGIGIVSHTFSILNNGDIDLFLYNTPLIEVSGNTSDFRLTVAPATTISPNDGTTFTIEFNPQTEGQKTATISIANNDDDENPFTFEITGYGIPFSYCGISEPLEIPSSTSYYISNVTTGIINNTTTYEEGRHSYYPAITPDYIIGSTSEMSITFETEENEQIGAAVWIDYNKDGDFFDPGEEIFTDLVEGSLTVSITRTFNFTIPDDVTEGITMMRVATYKGSFPPPCGPFLQTGEIEDYLVNFVGEEISTPKMNVYGGNLSIANGDNTPNVNDDTYFGSVEVGKNTNTHTFSIKNEGILDLILSGESPFVKLTGDEADFSLTSTPTTPIIPGGTSTFSIRFNPTEIGEKSVVVEILNNDPVRSPYTFRVQGNGKLLNDNDGDLVLDENDADDDNDGILDVEENSDCNSAVAFTSALFIEDFGNQSLEPGTPSVISPYLGSYEYQALEVGTVPTAENSLTANRYSIFNNIQEASSWASDSWQTIGDHTSGGAVASEGRMLMINTNQDVNSEYYRAEIIGNIDVDIPLDVSISVLNLDTDIPDNSGRILPNIEVIIEQGGNSFSVITTGDIPRHASGDVNAWKTFSGSFIPTISDPITIVLIDKAAQGNGNELALDDISISQTQVICDVDEDGIPNKLDLDSDNDGIYDVVEANGLDANNNGWADDDDDNKNNIATGGIPTSAGTGLIPTITEGEHADYVDLDSDNDGCSDANEAYGSPNADGGDDGRYGEGDPSILTNGSVSEALYIRPSDRDENTIPDYIQLSKTIVGITRDPFDALVLEGINVIFSVEMDLLGEGTDVSYQWQEDAGEGFEDLVNGEKYEGVNTALIRILNVDYSMSGNKYRVLVKSESFVCDVDVISAEALLTVAVSDLVTTKIVNDVNPYEGDEINYVINVDNNGPNDATNVSIIDILPIEVTYLSDNSAGDYNPIDGLWNIGNLSNGSTQSLIITAKVNTGLEGSTVRNQITVVTLDQLDLTTEGDVLFADFITNDLPHAVDDFSSAEEDTSVNINVLANDSFGSEGPSVGPINVISGTTSQGGSAVLNNGGTPDDPTDDTIDYTPKLDFNGTDTFEYEIMDLSGDKDLGVVTVTVNPVNDLPTAVNDSITILEDSDLNVIPVLTNDDFGGDGAGTFTITTVPTNGTAVIDDKETAEVIDDTVLYTPTVNFNGVDTFTYTISDTNGDTSEATVTVNITSVDDFPTANDDHISVEEDSGTTNIDVLANDDFGGDGPSTDAIKLVSGTSIKGGTVTVNNNGTETDPTDDTIDYTPKLDFFGDDAFSYDITDSDGDIATAIVTITVSSVNDEPTAVDDSAITSENSDEVFIAVLVNDSFGGDGPNSGAIALSGSGPTDGIATVNNNSTPTDPTDDGILYKPNPAFDGVDSFDYTITDTDGDTSTATVTVTIMAVNDDPFASDDSMQIDEDSGLNNLEVLVNDTFGNNGSNSIPIELTSSPTHGNAAINDNSTPNNPTDDSIDYTPFANFNGTDTLTYTIRDSDTGVSTATATITVLQVNDLPTATDDTITVVEDSEANIIPVVLGNGSGVLADDFGGDGPSQGSIILTSGGTTVNAVNPNFFNGTIVVDDNGTSNDPTDDFILYTPTPNFFGLDTFNYTIEDSDGDTSEATVTVTVTNVNDTPMAEDDLIIMEEDQGLTNIDVLLNDTFGGDGPSTGPITINVSPNRNGAIISVNDNGTHDNPTDDSIDFTPIANFNGFDSFEYTIEDADGEQSTATVSVLVESVNDVPIALDDTANVDEDSENNMIIVLTNDDFGGDGPNSGSIVLVTGYTAISTNDPSSFNGTVRVEDNGTPNDPTDDTIIYTPTENFNGEDVFFYSISDADGDTSTAQVNITVNPMPDAIPDLFNTNEDTSMVLDIFSNDNDLIPNSLLTFATVSNGSIEVDDNGTIDTILDDIITYIPNEDFNGTELFSYEVCPVSSPDDCVSADILVSVSPKLDIEDDFYLIKTNTIHVLDLYNNDNDIPSTGSITYTNPLNGSLAVDDRDSPNNPSDDIFTYTTNIDYIGIDSFEYTICDNDDPLYCQTGSVAINILYVGANDDIVITDEDIAADINFLENDLDVPPKGVITHELPLNGTASLNDNGTPSDILDDSFKYIPNSDYNGPDSFTYTICDVEDYCTSATISITINPIVDAINDVTSIYENMPADILILENDNDISADGTLNVSLPNIGTVEILDNGTPSDITDDYVNYTPLEGFSGEDEFTYTLCDAKGNCSTANVAITVIEIAKLTDDFITTEENIDVAIYMLDNDNYVPINGILIVSSPTSGIVSINNNNSPSDLSDDYLKYTPNDGFVGFDEFTYTICDGVDTSQCQTATITVEVEEGFKPSEFILPNEPGSTKKGFGFSPNGDGKNDVFRIHSDDGQHFIEEVYPNFKMEIFNRWGQRLFIYTHNGDPNSTQPGWDGKSNEKTKSTINAGGGVPAGTYFYTVYFNDGIRKPYTGWIYLSN